MLPGFEKIVESRIKKARMEGQFDNLPGSGKPLVFEDDRLVPEDLRLAYKILKNADFLPPEIELKKEIRRTEDLLENMDDTAEKLHIQKKLNFLIMKLNATRRGSIQFDMPQYYNEKLQNKIGASSSLRGKK